MTYIASFFHAFSSMGELARDFSPKGDVLSICVDQAETVARRVEKFAELMQSVWISRNDYERRITAV
jgi:hypothetical protein